MKNFAEWYLKTLHAVLIRPIYFYTFMEKGPVQDKSFSFLLMTSWILAAGSTITIFVISIVPMIADMVTGMAWYKLLLIFPLFILFSSIFLFILWMVIAPIIIVISSAAGAIIAIILHYISEKFGGRGELKENIKSIYYSSGTFVVPVLLSSALVISGKQKIMPADNVLTGINLLIFLTLIYLWGMWSIAVRKIYSLSKKKSVIATLIVVFLVILLQIVIGNKLILKLERWLV
mgnify:CR=1 FL=1